MKINVNVMKDDSEIINYDESGIPIYIKKNNLSSYTDRAALCHWHDDIEFMLILDGEINYSVNGQKISLKKNDGIIINSRQMHYGFHENYNDCTFICILFHPQLLSSNKILYKKYVLPVIENENVPYIYLDSSIESNHALLKYMADIYKLKIDGSPAYELEIVSLLYRAWTSIYKNIEYNEIKDLNNNYSEIKIQKDMVSYIYQHYSEKILLSNIAAAGGVCRSKCCKIFKQYLGQSPIDFLNTYRLEVSCNLLNDTKKSITDIALSTGFSNCSYYIELFQKQYKCTPRQFREK